MQEYDAIVEIPYFLGSRCNAGEDLRIYGYDGDIDKLDKVMEMYYPDYFNTYCSVMDSSHLSYCNMIIAKKEILDGYCAWLFDVLMRYEDVIDISGYDQEHKRIYGYFAEVMMNVYLRQHQLKVIHVLIFFCI